MTTPLLIAAGNGTSRVLNDGIVSDAVWREGDTGKTDAFSPAQIGQGYELSTFDGLVAIQSQPTAYQPRDFSIVLQRTPYSVNGLNEGWQNEALIAQPLQGNPSRLYAGSLYLEGRFGPMLPQTPLGHTRYGKYKIQGRAVPPFWQGAYTYAVGTAQGITVSDDRIDQSNFLATIASGTANAVFSWTNPGTAPCAVALSISSNNGGTSAYANTTIFVRNADTRLPRRVPVNLDANGNGYIDPSYQLMAMPGLNLFRIETSTPGALANGPFQLSLSGTRPRFLGNDTGRFNDSPVVSVPFRQGTATYCNGSSTLQVAKDGQARVGLSSQTQRNLCINSADPTSAAFTLDGGSSMSLTEAADPSGGNSVVGLLTRGSSPFNGPGSCWYQKNNAYNPSGVTITFSVYLRVQAGSLGSVGLQISGWNADTYMSPNIVVTTSWQRFTFTATFSAASNMQLYCGIYLPSNGDQVLVAWPQIEMANSDSNYQETNAAGYLTPSTINGAGLILEQPTTNLIPSGADAQSTYGTYYEWSGSSTSASTTNAVTPFYGSLCLQITAGASGCTSGWYFNNVSYTSGDQYTFSVWAMATAPGAEIYFYCGASSGYVSIPIDAQGIWKRYSYTYTATSSGSFETHVFAAIIPANATVYFGPGQIENTAFPTTWTDSVRYGDIVAPWAPQNYVASSRAFETWTAAGTSAATPAINTATAASDGLYWLRTWTSGAASNTLTSPLITADVPPSSTAWTVRLAAWQGSVTTGNFTLALLDQSGNTLGSTTIAASGLSSSAKTSFSLTVAASAIGASVSGFKIQLTAPGAGTILLEDCGLTQGSHPGISLYTSGSPIVRPTNAPEYLGGQWVQNGGVRFDYLWPYGTSAPGGADFSLFGDGEHVIELHRYNNVGAGNNTVSMQRETSSGAYLGGGGTAAVFDGAWHTVELVWSTYYVGAERFTYLLLYVDGALVGQNSPGNVGWATPERLWLSSGQTFGIIANLIPTFPSAPSGQSGASPSLFSLPSGAIPYAA